MAISGNGWDVVSVWDACRASGGSNALDARSTNAGSVKDCAMSYRSAIGRTRPRSKTPVGLYRGAPDTRIADATVPTMGKRALKRYRAQQASMAERSARIG